MEVIIPIAAFFKRLIVLLVHIAISFARYLVITAVAGTVITAMTKYFYAVIHAHEFISGFRLCIKHPSRAIVVPPASAYSQAGQQQRQ